MYIKSLAQNATNEHLFYLMQKAYKHGYYVHPEFYDEFDRRADHPDMEQLPPWPIWTQDNTRELQQYCDIFKHDINIAGTVTGRIPCTKPLKHLT